MTDYLLETVQAALAKADAFEAELKSDGFWDDPTTMDGPLPSFNSEAKARLT